MNGNPDLSWKDIERQFDELEISPTDVFESVESDANPPFALFGGVVSDTKSSPERSQASAVVPYDGSATTTSPQPSREPQVAPQSILSFRPKSLAVGTPGVHAVNPTQPEFSLTFRPKNLAVANSGVQALTQTQPVVKDWAEQSLESRFENLSTIHPGFSRSNSIGDGYCDHGFVIIHDVATDRFSPYDPPMYKPVAERCQDCSVSFLRKELYEIRHGFMKRKNQESIYSRNTVRPTIRMVRLHWQWMWAIQWKEHKWRTSGWGGWNETVFPHHGPTIFEVELHDASEGETIQLPKPFSAGYGRWPGWIMC